MVRAPLSMVPSNYRSQSAPHCPITQSGLVLHTRRGLHPTSRRDAKLRDRSQQVQEILREIRLLQTTDPLIYYGLFQITSTANRAFCHNMDVKTRGISVFAMCAPWACNFQSLVSTNGRRS